MTSVIGIAVAVATFWLAADLRSGGGSRWLFAVPALAAGLAVAFAGDPFILRKLVGRALMPPGLVGLGLVGVTGWAFLRQARGLGSALAALTVAFWLAGNTLIGAVLLAGLEAPYPPADVAQVGRLDAVYVLGGGTTTRPDDARPALSAAGGRVFQGARWYLAGGAKVLVTGGRSVAGLAQKKARDLAGETAGLWRAMGVPDNAIVRLEGPRNTAEEMDALAQAAKSRGWTRVGLVTSAWHMRRTMHHARRAGLDPVPIPADYRGRVPVVSAVAALPSAHGVYQVKLALWEHLGLLVAD